MKATQQLHDLGQSLRLDNITMMGRWPPNSNARARRLSVNPGRICWIVLPRRSPCRNPSLYLRRVLFVNS